MAKVKSETIPESGTVSVACNFSNGLVLKLYNMEETDEPVLGGGTRTRKVAVETGDVVTIFGPALEIGKPAKCLVVNGYAITPNVDAQFMSAWMEQNKETRLVKNGIVRVYSKEDSARDACKDFGAMRSGMEPLTPGTDDKGAPYDPRVKRRTNTQISAVGTSDVAA